MTKNDSPDPVTAGNNITYTITVNNAGPSDAVGTQLTDGVPTGTTFVSFTAPAGWTTVMIPPVGGTGGITATKTVAAGEPASVFTLVVKVNSNASAGSSIMNLASIGSGTNDPNQANNTSVANTTVNTAADLSVTKTGSPDPVIAGTDLTYTINVSNAGPSDAQGVTVTDDLSLGTSFVSATPSQGTCSGTGPVSVQPRSDRQRRDGHDHAGSQGRTWVERELPALERGLYCRIDGGSELGEQLGDSDDDGRDICRPGGDERPTRPTP